MCAQLWCTNTSIVIPSCTYIYLDCNRYNDIFNKLWSHKILNTSRKKGIQWVYKIGDKEVCYDAWVAINGYKQGQVKAVKKEIFSRVGEEAEVCSSLLRAFDPI